MITVLTNISLDGVMQAPARADEDTRGGFAYGGWATPYQAMQHAGAAFANIAGLRLGRRTYQDFSAVWPSRPESPYTAFLNGIPKYVMSRTLEPPLAWRNSTIIDDVEKISGDVLVLGTGQLIHGLAERNLINQYIVLIHPLVLGSGLRLFPEGAPYAKLRVVETKTTDNGVVMATYVPGPKVAISEGRLSADNSVMSVVIRRIEPRDEPRWRELWDGYTRFYEREPAEPITRHLWSRIQDATVPVWAIVAEDSDHGVIGMANYVIHENTSSLTPVCYLEDLFVDPSRRAGGVGKMLIDWLVSESHRQGWSRLYWHTRETNYRARGLYDTYTPHSGFLRYAIAIR